MKRKIFIILALMLLVVGCTTGGNTGTKQETMSKEGLEPYSFTDKELELLRYVSLNIVRIVNFNVPEAETLIVNLLELNDEGKWIRTGGTFIELGPELENTDMAGNLTMILQGNQDLDLSLNLAGTSAYVKDNKEANLDAPDTAVTAAMQLDKHREVALNEEIPVAIFLQDNEGAPTFTVEDFHSTEKFSGYNSVRAVTMTFKP